MTSEEARENGIVISDYYKNDKGYKVKYPNGYTFWCPSSVFEEAYFPISDENGDKITFEDVDNFSVKVESKLIGTKTTNTTITCLTGYEVHGQSSCVNADNYDNVIGESFAKPKAQDGIWDGLGFVLQWGKYGLTGFAKDESKIPPHVQRMIAEHNELDEKIVKLKNFINHNIMFDKLNEDAQYDMIKQLESMTEYDSILQRRIMKATKNIIRTKQD